MDVFLGIDLGTSGLKLTVLGVDGAPVADAESAYLVRRRHPGWAETYPADWGAALHAAVEEIRHRMHGHRLAGIGVTGQMHGLVVCDGTGRPTRPAILWPDRRAADQLARWRCLPAATRARLANPLVPGMTGPIVAWLREHEPEPLSRAEYLLLPKDYLRGLIGGPPVTDRSDASATLLWDVVGDDWSPEALQAAGVDADLLPEVTDPAAVVGQDRWVANRLGRPAGGVPVVAGCADTPAAMLAVALAPADLADEPTQINLGTGAQVLRRVSSPEPVPDPTTHLYAAADQGWYAMAAVQNAGLALDWVGRVLDLTWSELISLAATVPAGAGGVSFLPFLTGERGGIAGPTSRGGWLGLHAAHGRADLARAAVEAMIFTVRRAAELVGPIGSLVRLTGGGGRSPLIQQLIADVLGVVVRRVEVRSSSAAGAAMLAAAAIGTTLTPRRADGPAVEPRPDQALEDSYRRWCDRRDAADTDDLPDPDETRATPLGVPAADPPGRPGPGR